MLIAQPHIYTDFLFRHDTKQGPKYDPSPFLGVHEDGGHLNIWIQDLINLHLCLMIDAVLVLRVAEVAIHVVHGGEVVVALPLGSQSYLVTVVLNL